MKAGDFKMKSGLKCTAAISSIFVLGLIIYSFLFGILFPYSPIIIGFDRRELANTVVYVQEGAGYPDLNRIDSVVPKVEAFHEWKFLTKPRIFIFRDKESYHRRSISRARFCAFYNGNLFISPWALSEAKMGEISLEIYLIHELSHCLLHQHSGILRAAQYPEWLLEGLAVYSANQMGTSWYPSKKEIYDDIRKGNFMPPEYFKTRKEDQINLAVKYRITFMYSEFACIVDYLVEKYGKDKLLSFAKALTSSSSQDQTFKGIYGVELRACIEEFRKSILRQG